MLSLTHNTNALCCCNDFSLPPLIKCVAKLSGKYFLFTLRRSREKMTERKQYFETSLLSPALPPCPILLCRGRREPTPIIAHSQMSSLVITASNQSNLHRIQIPGILFLFEGLLCLQSLSLCSTYPQFITDLEPVGAL